MKILIAYDGSDCADRALTDLRRAGLPRQAEAMVISVAEQWFPPPPPSRYEIVETALALSASAEATEPPSQAVEQVHVLAVQASKLVKSLFPAWKVSGEAYSGSPARELITRANEWSADLIVVGSHGRSALGRFILGSVSQRVVTEAACSVRIARGSQENKNTRVRIIIGVDGSSCSGAAVRAVTERTWPPGSEAYVITVYDPIVPTAIGQFIPPVVEWVEEGNEGQLARARRVAEGAAKELRRVGLAVSTIVNPGDPRHMLLEEAERLAADSIFVGARGLSRIDQILLGSVSTAIATRAHCSVEVVRSRLET